MEERLNELKTRLFEEYDKLKMKYKTYKNNNKETFTKYQQIIEQAVMQRSKDIAKTVNKPLLGFNELTISRKILELEECIYKLNKEYKILSNNLKITIDSNKKQTIKRRLLAIDKEVQEKSRELIYVKEEYRT